MRKRTTSFVRLLIFTLLTLSTGAVWGQVTIDGVTADSPVHFAGNSDFSVGELTVSFNMPTGKTSGELQVNLAAGIEYMSGTVTATGATVSLKTGSTDANKPVFTLTGASGSVTVKFKRKATKAVLTNPALAGGLQDEAVLTVQGLAASPAVKNLAPYQLPRPTLTVQLPTTQTDVLGARTETFDIRNTGQGKVRDVYFSIAYPADVVGNSVSYNGSTLTAVGTVPTGLPNAGKPIYKIPNANLANNGVVTITEKYTVNKCTTGRQNTYYAYWGSGIANSNDIFETNSNTRNISVSTGTPIIKYNDSNAFTYFEWKNGFCGNILGTYYVRYDNVAADAKGTAYNLEIRLFDADESQKFSRFEPVNIRLIAKNGTTIPLAATVGTGDTRLISLSNLPALSDASLGSTDLGLTDADNDGFRDDLKKGAYFQIAFDLKKKEGITCLQPGIGVRNFLSIQPRSQVLSSNVCGDLIPSEQHILDNSTLRVYFNGVNDASKLPAQLVQNVPSAAYIAPGMNWPSLGAGQRLKNGNVVNVERQFKYVITTPAGMKLQNVKLYRKANVFGVSTEAAVNQLDIEPNSTRTIITNNQPSDSPFGTPGYLTFDVLLQNCNGGTAPITYSVYMMLKNGDGTYCDIPLVCNQVTNVPTICSTPCAIQGPRMLSTKVERADNSYGWKDHTMAIRQTRANVSPIERMRALYLDDIEFISEGQQHVSKTDTNLFYYVKVENTAQLEPKKITLKVNGGTEQTFTATPNNPMRGTNAAGKNYFRWNLTSLLPTSTLPAGATFTAVATYQVKNSNPTNSNERTMDIQSGIESFFYTLDNPATDVAISTEGYHTAEKHCGANLTPVFYIAETRHLLATNRYTELSGCDAATLGSNLIYAARRFKPGGTYFSQEFRPARLIKKITIKMPSAYQIKNMQFTYTYKIGATTAATVDMSKLIMTDDGTWKTYTYENPPKGTLGYLPPGMITVENDYNEYIKAFIQPSCKAKTVDVNKTIVQQEAEALTKQEKIDSKIEYEDFYYHYADTGDSSVAVDLQNDRPILFAANKKPEITIEAISQLTVKANKRTMEATFKLKNAKSYDAPFGWISVPDVAGIEVLSLEETTPGNTYTYIAKNTITGEKMFFLSDKGNDGKVLKNTERQFKLKYKVTNCAVALQLKVYAGWNCNGNPTTGYRNTCSDKSITYNIAIAKSKKEIAADPGNPGENDPNKKGSIPMCTATPYTYVINSAEEGDIYNAKLVVTQRNGITISNVKVEYPLGGTVYTEGTGAGKILHTQSGNRHTYDISNILPEGSLPGSLNEPNNANKRKFKLTFDVTPDCDFSAGSSFDIDVEGTNLCDSPAAGDKTRAIIAGIQGVNISDYSITLDPLQEVSGNGSACDANGVTYKAHIEVNSGVSGFQMGTNARLKFTIPDGYELVADKQAFARTTDSWADPVRKNSEEAINEVIIDIPAGMKNGQFFDYGIRIRQKADVLIDCDITNPKKLKVIATDTKTGVMCNGIACPPITVSTSKEEKVVIKNERPKLSLKDVSATSTAQAGKENLTIKYKIENGTGTDVAALANGTVKAALYYDANHNNIVDIGDIELTTYTTTALNLAKGATSAEQSFTFVVDQDKVCRLLLVLKNEDNVCLCGDVVAPLTAPEKITGLVDNLTVCESETKKVAYSAAGASYDQYTWTGKTANDKLDYLSAANVKEPNFHYNGTKLTATQTFIYKLTIKRTNGCEASQQVQVTVKPATATPSAPSTHTFCQGATIESLKDYIDNTVSGTIRVYADNTTTTTLADNVALTATTYYYSAEESGRCESNRAPFTVTIQNITAPTVVEAAAPTCTDIRVAKLNYTANTTYTFVKSADNSVVTGVTVGTDGVISNLPVGKYKVKATKDGCTSDLSDEFEIKDKEPVTAITTSPAGATYTQNATATALSVVSSGTTPTAYKWYRNTTNSKTGSDVTQVATTATYTPLTDQIGSFFYWVELTGCGTVESAIAEIKVTPSIDAVDDGEKSVPSTGGEVEVLGNDKLNGNPATKDNVTVSIDNPNGLTGLTINEGKIVVPNGSTLGTYEVTYKICDKTHSNVCDTAKVKITVTGTPPPTIVANDDPDTSVAKGGTVDILTNDRLNGNPVAPTDVDITIPNKGGLTDLTVDSSTGKLKVPDDATPGTYEVEYKICVHGATTPCDTAKVKITVTGTPPPTIVANDDPDTSVAKGGTVDILSNDRLNGNPVAPTDVDITIPNKGGLTNLTVDSSTGKLKVPDDATPGTYEVEYRICVKGATSPCDTAKVKITVTSAKRTIKAVDDNFGKISNSVDYTTTSTVFSSGVDTLEGVLGILSPETDVILHKGEVARQDGTAVQAGTITMNNNGSITVKKGTPVGIYTYTYKICEKAVPTNCSEEAKVTFEVVDNTILAKDDEYEVGTLGGLTPSVLNNDIFAGKVGVITNEVIIEPTSTERNDDPKLEMRFVDGRVDVKEGIAPGIHKYYYTISDKNDKTKSSSAVVTIKVVSFTAVDDEDEIINDKSKEQKIPSVLSNDEIGGKRPTPNEDVIFTPTKVKDKDGNEVPGIVINPQDGTITIAPNTPDGVYTYNYTICKKTAPTECKTAKGVLRLLPALEANDDDFTATPVNTTKRAVNVGNVLKNDKYAGEEALNNLDKLTAVIADNDGLVGAKIDEQGNLIIPQGTPVRVYNPTYYLCMKDHPGVCKTAKIRVEVIKDKPLTIYNGVSADGDGHNDYFKIDGIEYYPKNNLKIFNRWGVLVYEKDGYTNNQPFDGHSNGRVTISTDSKLPQGTYYYILEYEDSNDQSHTEKGWLYLKY